ncbi:MAG: DNA polymerase III subunit alpha [Cyclobacteriaceae bacterium]|jgi:DNA-directed DNA polymerase III PolC|nr:DNA polymerase III subunit alpha [Cytophagales bacterium]MCZ8326809.1 DNA polymerase III subunit alpha [Cyclobacteriaceae bacterium]
MYLNCHTWYSFKYGTLSVQQLLSEIKRCGVRKFALTEINNTASYIELLRLCSEMPDENKPELALGIEFKQDNTFCFIALAKNNAGFANINRYLSALNKQGKEKPLRAPLIEDVFIIYPLGRYEPETLLEHEFIGVKINQVNQLITSKTYSSYPHKYVVWHPVTFADKQGYNVHRLLRAIDNNIVLSKISKSLTAQENEVMLSEAELCQHFSRLPAILNNTKKLLDACSISFELHQDKNKKTLTGSETSDWDMLVTEAWEGFQQRYDASDPVMRERFQRELNIIREKNFCAYYLIAYDLIQFANASGFDHVGRGSGANSMVAYCLGITNVDPIELDLYFERFLNSERTSPPDFDLDFSWTDRNAIYDYLFQKYGPDHICLLGTHVTYQSRSVLRELGKVFGLPKEEIDDIVENPRDNLKRDHIRELIFRYAAKMVEMPANVSIHAGGVLITEKPIYQYTALELPPKGYPVSQFDMHNAEDIGIYKFDILSQRGLGHIKESVRIIRKNKKEDVNIYRFDDFKKDEKVRELLRSSRAMGCFYVESPAMRQLLGKLQCEDYLTLVAASSIIRPGVAQSGMMRAYIERFHTVRNGGTYESIHPKMDELMKETYGVMVYQEDVIKVAHHFAGLTLTQADVLRRGMSGKYRSRKEFDKVRESFFENCKQRGYADAVTDRVWFEIESFSGYSFAKGHSASFAVESYQSLYLKAHYPLEFMVGVINNFGGFYSTEFYVHEARMSGAAIQAPCVNKSVYLTDIEGTNIYLGFIHLKGLESKLAKSIEQDRNAYGPFTGMGDFLRRLQPSLEQARILIRIGAFRFTQKTKQQLLWEAMLYFSETKNKMPVHGELFVLPEGNSQLPTLEYNPIEDAFDEIELLGFPLCDPFTLLKTTYRGDTVANELTQKLGQEVAMVGYLVTTKDTRTKNKDLMHFGTFYDCQGLVFDTVHFPDTARQHPFRGRGFYGIRGKVVEDFGVPIVEVHSMKKLPLIKKAELSELER